MGKITTSLKAIAIFFLVILSSKAFAAQEPVLSIVLDQKINNSCSGAMEGKLLISVIGGSGSLTYSWTGPDTFSAHTEDLSGLPSGIYKITVTDESLPVPLFATAEYSIINEDIEKPSIKAPPAIIGYTDSEKCSATQVNLGTPITSDNCSVAEVTHNAPTSFLLGETKVIWLVTDSSGNTQTALQTITILDNEKPEITAPAPIRINTDPGSCETQNVILGTPVVSDNCSIQSIVNDAPEVFPLGTTIVTWTVTDNSENKSYATQEVTVEDKEAPGLTVPADLSVSTDPGKCTASNVALGSAGITDNCSGATLINNAPLTFPIGTTDVLWTVTDASNNSTSLKQTVTVKDSEKPVIIAPADIFATTDPGSCQASAISLGAPIGTDNCSEIVFTHNAPASFPIGNTEVLWTATDAAGNTATATQTVNVEDDEDPKLTIPNNLSISADPGKCTASNVTLGAASFTDNCSGATIVNNAPLTFPIGTTDVLWTVTDASNNSTSLKQTITVKDSEKPVITAPADIFTTADPGSCEATAISLGTPIGTDNCSEVIFSHNAPASFPIGKTEVLWTATDATGNTASAIQIINVKDEEAPKLNVPAHLSISTDPGKCTASSVALGSASFTDNCSGTTVVNNAPLTYPIGTTVVIWTATDASNNSTSLEQTITVNDIEKPVITAPVAITVNASPGSCTATGVALGTPQVTDNCTAVTVQNNAPAAFPLGKTTVTWTATDAAGNSSTTIQTVTVVDKQPPVIATPAPISVPNDLGKCSAVVNIPAPAVADNCSSGNAVGTRSDGIAMNAAFPVGTTTITWNVTDANGNKAVPVTQTVTVKDLEPPRTLTLKDVIWGCEYTLNVPYTIDNCSGSIAGTTSDPLTYSTPGTHTVTWTFSDSYGNTTKVDQKVIIEPVTAEAKITPVLCNGFSTGSVTVIASGGVGPYTYSWATLGSGPTKTNLAAGTYKVSVTDVNGCKMAPMDVVISEPDSFIEVGFSFNVGCYGKADATATAEVKGGTGSYSYLWSNGQTTKTAIALSSGNHSVTITDENGCTATRTIFIPEAKELKIAGFSTTETTAYGSATATATANVTGGTAPYIFEWSNGQRNQIARGLDAGTYTVTVTDANGCSVTDSVVIIDSLEGTIIPSSLCLTEEGGIRVSTFRTEAVRGGTGPYTYSWNFGEGATPKTGTGAGPLTVEYSNTGDKNITLTITDSKGLSITETLVQYVGECFETCGNTENFDINVNTFYVGKEDGSKLTSADCSYTGKKYIFLRSTTNANAYSPTVEYIYTLRDLDNGGAVVGTYNVLACLAEFDNTTKKYLKIPELLNLGEVAAWSCGYSITMENFFMSWTNNAKRGCGENPSMMCLSTNERDEIMYPLYASIKATDLLCYNSMTGTITASASGGKLPYSYSLNGGPFVSDNVFTNLDGGTYTVTVKDADGQIYEAAPKNVLEPANPLTIKKPVVSSPITCYGGSDGTATVEVSGGSPFATGNPYIYVWSNKQTTPTATGLSAGTYTVTIIDANGCELTETIVIEQPDYIPANAGSDIVLSCGTNYTTIGTHNAEDVTGSWEILNGPAGGKLEDPNSPVTVFTGNIGTYTLRWKVSCGPTDDVKITISDCNTIDFDGADDQIDFGDTFNLSGDFSIEAWVKSKSNTESRTILSKKSMTNYNASGYSLLLNNGFPEFRWNGNVIASSAAIGTDRWYHLNVTSNSEGTKLYVDGIEMAAGSSAAPVNNNTPFIVGGITEGSQPYITRNNFHGWIEEVRIWNKALTEEQLRFMMNQRLTNNAGMVKGEEIPFNVPGGLSWNNLLGYYHMDIIEEGYTLGQTATSPKGKLRNITTLQQRSAPLPYISRMNGNWNDISTATTPWVYGEGIWDAPNSKGINNTSIDWNIVRSSHNIKSGQQNITLLGLLSEKGRLSISDATMPQNEYNRGHSLRITHYLSLNGVIDLVGESQLLQDAGSILEEESNGYIERDQQGTASSYNYNYWSSPVSPPGSPNNAPYTLESVLRDGTNSAYPVPLNFNFQYHFADAAYSGPKRISTYWLNVYTNKISSTYSQWQNVKEKGSIKTGEGYSMKGTLGSAAILDRQNYVFMGKPHNGDITLTVNAGNDYLIGNPYPSAIDGYQFILDNIKESGGNSDHNVFNGTLYFWDHFSGKTHYLQEYVGGYATLNLSGGLEAVATDARINATGEKAKVKPERYVPVGQAFYVSTKLAPELENLTTITGGEILFQNSQRVFETDDQLDDNSVFKSRETKKPQEKAGQDNRQKIYLHYRSPEGYHRQLLVTSDPNTTSGFDLGYDAAMIENNKEDMYWIISDYKFVIQGVPDFDKTRELPLGVRVKAEGLVLIEIDKLLNIPDDFKIYLHDKYTQEIHDLRSGAFQASAVAGATEDRFSVIFEKIEEVGQETEETTEEEEPTEEETPEETEEGTEEGEKPEEENQEEKEKPEGEIGAGQGSVEEQKPAARAFEISYSTRYSEIRLKNPENLEILEGALYNALGQKLTEFRNIPADDLVTLPISNLAPGVYLFVVEMNDDKKTVRFIVE